YDDAGNPVLIKYINSAGVEYRRLVLSFDRKRVINIEWLKKERAGFINDRQMKMECRRDGNLLRFTDHRLPVAGQQDILSIDLYEDYDNKINPVGFLPFHPSFFENHFLLPGLELQKNNPGKFTHTGNGTSYREV